MDAALSQGTTGFAPLHRATRWMKTAQGAISARNLPLALSATRTAEATLGLIQPQAAVEGHLETMERARAVCRLLHAEVATYEWRLDDAERELDQAYKGLRDSAEFEVQIIRCTARLAEHRGRWVSALAAWKRVAARLPDGDSAGLADVRIRMAEVELLRENVQRATVHIEEAEALSLELNDDLIKARVRLLRATVAEFEQKLQLAGVLYREVEVLAAKAPREFLGLLRLRAARPLIRFDREYALDRVEMGFADLEADHPDAHGITLSQLAVMALILEQPALGAISAMTAECWRGGMDGTNRPLLCEALNELGRPDLAEELQSFEGPAVEFEALCELVGGEASTLRVEWADLKSACTVGKLVAALRHSTTKATVVVTRTTLPPFGRALLLRQRASLTWDAPWAPEHLDHVAVPAPAETAPQVAPKTVALLRPPRRRRGPPVWLPSPGWIVGWAAVTGFGSLLSFWVGLAGTTLIALALGV